MWCLRRAYQLLCLVFCFLNFQAYLSSSLSSSSSSSLTQLCSHDEAAKLIQFKSSFSIDVNSSSNCDDAGMKSYPKTDSWKEGTDCCLWDGVTCDDINGHVIGLDLSCSQLYGSIPSNSTLFHLPHLQKLNLAFNCFGFDEMSSKFGEFPSLVYLNLSLSCFVGQVPSQVSHLSKLVSLDFSLNFDLTFDKHTLEGLVNNLTEVRQLFLDETNIYSINPNVLMNLSSSLRSLSLRYCGLQGKFPENIFRLPNLELFSVGGNYQLNLSLPKMNRSSHLKYLDLSQMYLSRELFDSIGNIVSLKHLDLSASNLSGSISKSLGNFSQLSYLDLSANSFSGHIPDEVSVFPNLIHLDLSHNLLNGTLPSWLYTISSLKSIDLSYNQFRGHIKQFQYNSLEKIHLQNNELQGPIPSSLSQLVNLTALRLSSNDLSGIVEFGMFSKLQNLLILDLSSNNLSLKSTGTSVDYTLPNLQHFYFSACNLSEFPQFLRDSKSMEYLDLSNNKIYGKIPKWMWDVGKDSLLYLNLSHNSLTDIEQLPWKEIQVLDLSSNLIHGNLPIPPLPIVNFLISSVDTNLIKKINIKK